MFDVITDHVVIPFGDNAMGLYNNGAIGDPLVTAERADGTWTIHAEGVDDVTVDNRSDALDALLAHALLLPGAKAGYSTTVPHGLREQP